VDGTGHGEAAMNTLQLLAIVCLGMLVSGCGDNGPQPARGNPFGDQPPGLPGGADSAACRLVLMTSYDGGESAAAYNNFARAMGNYLARNVMGVPVNPVSYHGDTKGDFGEIAMHWS
jgi:hypothetical protein